MPSRGLTFRNFPQTVQIAQAQAIGNTSASSSSDAAGTALASPEDNAALAAALAAVPPGDVAKLKAEAE